MTATPDRPSEPWAGDPRLIGAVEAQSLERLGESMRALAARVEHSRALDGGKLWTDPPVQAELGAVYDEISRRLVDGAQRSNTILFEFFDGGILDAYSTCLTGVLDGRSPAERAADFAKFSFAERVALVEKWARLEAAQADEGLDDAPANSSGSRDATSDPVALVNRALSADRPNAPSRTPGRHLGGLDRGATPGPAVRSPNGHERGSPRTR